ncbi:MAG: outer membrane beta-barrel protein [candidate division Zixibacteria bacterium]|nr:outer membrane beta-barrel protein [candidate division Zixibacteria bacterium]
MKVKLVVVTLALFVLFVGIPAFSQSMIGLQAIGGKVGYVDPEDIDGTFGFGAIADLGTFMPQFGWEAEVTYWSTSVGDLDFRDIAIVTSGKYSFPMPESKLAPFIGGGLGLHMLKASFEYVDPFTGQTVEDDETDSKFGFHILGGTEMELSPMIDGFAEFRYTLVEDFNQIWLMAGIKYNLGM